MKLIFIWILLAFGCDACSRRRKTDRMSRLHVAPGPDQCGCVPLHTCPIFSKVLQGARPLDNQQLTALRRATCDPIGDPKDPNVKCCDRYLNVIEEIMNSVDDTIINDIAAEPSAPIIDFEKQCGICDPSLDPRIVGGSDARIGQFPWIARLGFVEDDSKMTVKDAEFLCGGSLISHYHILTAAHCIERAKYLSQVKWVRLGEYDERTSPDCSKEEGCAPPTQDIKIEWATPHPKYRPSSFRNDIGIIKLEQPVNFTTWVHPICLPTRVNANLTGLRAVVAGWGTNQPGAPGSVPVLQYLWKKIVNSDTCMEQYRGITGINPGQLCAEGKKGQDSCNGDSGGPLARPETSEPGGDGFYTLVGVVSFGVKLCGSGGLPGVYANVAQYMEWIKAVTDPTWSPGGGATVRRGG